MRVSVLDNLVGACRTRDQMEDVEEEIAELNADYALVLSGNAASVMYFEDVTKFRLLQVGAFKQWFANQTVTVGKRAIPVGDYWLSHPQRRQYHGIEFEPKGGRESGTIISGKGSRSSRSRAIARSFWRT